MYMQWTQFLNLYAWNNLWHVFKINHIWPTDQAQVDNTVRVRANLGEILPWASELERYCWMQYIILARELIKKTKLVWLQSGLGGKGCERVTAYSLEQ